MNQKESQYDIIDIDMKLIIFNEDNINEMSESKLARLEKSIREDGITSVIQVVPIQMNGETYYRSIGGEHRVRAAQRAGYQTYPAQILDDPKWLDESEFQKKSFTLNSIHGKLNREKAGKLIQKLHDSSLSSEQIQEALGLTETEEWKNLGKEVIKSLKESNAPDEVIDEVKKVKAKSPEQLSKKINTILKKYYESLNSQYSLIFQSERENFMIPLDLDSFQMLKNFLNDCKEKNIDPNALLKQKFSD